MKSATRKPQQLDSLTHCAPITGSRSQKARGLTKVQQRLQLSFSNVRSISACLAQDPLGLSYISKSFALKETMGRLFILRATTPPASQIFRNLEGAS